MSRHDGPIPGPREDTPEWQENINPDTGLQAFGASDAAAACNRSHYRTALDLYMKARGELAEQEPPEELAKRWRRGRRIQPVILAEYADEKGVEVIEPLRRFFHPLKSFMSCTPDGVAMPADGNRYGVECKGTTERMYAAATAIMDGKYGRDGTDIVPDDVLFQAQQQMDVMDWDTVDVVVFFGLFTMRVYPVPRSDTIIDAITTAEQELSERIADGRPPEPNWTHPNTKQLLAEVQGLHVGRETLLTLEVESYWEDYKDLGRKIKELELEREGARNRVYSALGDAEVGKMPGMERELRRVVVKESTYTDADAAALQAKVGQVKRRGYERIIERKAR